MATNLDVIYEDPVNFKVIIKLMALASSFNNLNISVREEGLEFVIMPGHRSSLIRWFISKNDFAHWDYTDDLDLTLELDSVYRLSKRVKSKDVLGLTFKDEGLIVLIENPDISRRFSLKSLIYDVKLQSDYLRLVEFYELESVNPVIIDLPYAVGDTIYDIASEAYCIQMQGKGNKLFLADEHANIGGEYDLNEKVERMIYATYSSELVAQVIPWRISKANPRLYIEEEVPAHIVTTLSSDSYLEAYIAWRITDDDNLKSISLMYEELPDVSDLVDIEDI